MNIKEQRAVRVSDEELNNIKKFFSDNYGAKSQCEAQGYASIATIWRFLETGKARPAKIIGIRKFISEYEPATI